MEDKERELIFEVAGMAGDILLRSGAEISRVDETMRRIACAYELENVSTFVLSNGIFLTSETEGSNHQVRVRHIPLAGARLDPDRCGERAVERDRAGLFHTHGSQSEIKRD